MSMVLVASLAFIAGALLGYFLLRSGILGHARIVELEQALAASEAERAEYKQQVTAEFTDTAEKFRALNRSYEDLHRQLAKSANVLCGEAGAPKLLDSLVSPALPEQAATTASSATSLGVEAEEVAAHQSADNPVGVATPSTDVQDAPTQEDSEQVLESVAAAAPAESSADAPDPEQNTGRFHA